MGRRMFLGALAAALCVGLLTPASPASASQVQLGRWFGAEGGFMETACYGLGFGCPAFSAFAEFGGAVGAQVTDSTHRDADLIERHWPARTGNYLYLADVIGGAPGLAYLSTSGSDLGPIGTGTIAFSIRVDVLPLQPVVIFQHLGTTLGEEPMVTITLTPDGSLVLSGTAAVIGATAPLSVTPLAWHTVTVTDTGQNAAPVRMYLDDQQPVKGNLSFQGPTGDVNLGIVSPTSTPFTLGLDDFVESPVYDAPIRGARINYLVPYGAGSNTGWNKGYPIQSCNSAAQNWQLVSEDQWVTVPSSDGPLTCNLAGSGLFTSTDGTVDEYATEGVPSRFQSSSLYHRNVSVQPRGSDTILGVRLRVRGLTDGPPLTWNAGYVDAGVQVNDRFTFDNGGTGGSQMEWGPNHASRPYGQPWTAQALGGLTLRLGSGTGLAGSISVRRSVGALRLDYVWIPS